MLILYFPFPVTLLKKSSERPPLVVLNNNGFTLCHQTPLANIWTGAQQGSDSFLSDDNIPHQAFRHTATAWIGLVYYQVYRYIAILVKMSIAQRWLLLGRQTWDLHDCDCGLMVVAGTCTRAIIVSTTQYFPVVHLLQRRRLPQTFRWHSPQFEQKLWEFESN